MGNQNTNVFIFCGKSASGKSSLVKYSQAKVPNSVWVKADTTRPKRGDSDKEYNFISDKAFLNRSDMNEYIKSNCFRGWHYGLPYKSFIAGKNNFCIASPAEVLAIKNAFPDWNVYVIYLDVSAILRLKRSAVRKGYLTFEHLRRLFTDMKDFRNFQDMLEKNFSSQNLFIPSQLENKSLFWVAQEIFDFLQGKIVKS